MSVGFWQLVLILFIILVLFGAGRLPRVMYDLGKGLRSFKDGLRDGENGSASISGERKAAIEEKKDSI